MRAVVTRVKSASVAVDGKTMGAIGQGLLILLGIAPEDTPAHCKKLADKINAQGNRKSICNRKRYRNIYRYSSGNRSDDSVFVFLYHMQTDIKAS